MAERHPEQQNKEPRAVNENMNENIADQAQQQAETIRETAQRGEETIETAANASRQAVEKGTSELQAQSEQASEQAAALAKEFFAAQTSVVEVAMRTVENAADAGTSSTRLWASAGSAWIEMMQKLMQLNIDSVRRLREAQDFSRPFEAQAGLMRDTIKQLGRSQSRLMESAQESAAAAGRQIQNAG
jgi:hypothetical protein